MPRTWPTPAWTLTIASVSTYLNPIMPGGWLGFGVASSGTCPTPASTLTIASVRNLRDHPLKTAQIFTIFDPYPSPVGSFLLLSVGKFGQVSSEIWPSVFVAFLFRIFARKEQKTCQVDAFGRRLCKYIDQQGMNDCTFLNAGLLFSGQLATISTIFSRAAEWTIYVPYSVK